MGYLQIPTSGAASSLEATKKIRKKFGVSFHPGMDLKTLAAQWNEAIKKDANIVKKYPGVAAAMTAATATAIAQDVVTTAKDVATQIKNIATIVTTAISSANPLSPNPSYIGTTVAAEATAIALAIEAAVIKEVTDQITALLASVPEVPDVPLPAVPSTPTTPTVTPPKP